MKKNSLIFQNNKGIAPVIIILIVLIGLAGGYVAYTQLSERPLIKQNLNQAIKDKMGGQKDAIREGIEKYLVIATRDCRDLARQIQIEKVIAKTDNEIYVVVNLTESQKDFLTGQSCVNKIVADKEEAHSLIAQVRQQLNQETLRDLKKYKLERTILRKDIASKEELIEYLQNKHQDIPVQPEQIQPGQISSYQTYVTPNDSAVNQIAQSQSGSEDIYNYGTSNWVWVADEVLYGQIENWIYPNYFLTVTPDLASNPTPNQVAGDCEEQANALASTLRAGGVLGENVRVVLGLVNFDGNIGGHAWVEIYQNNQWVPLDATSGPYYDNGEFVASIGLPFDYFATHEFPVLERWFYYNDQYFHDVEAASGNAPSHWLEQGTPTFEF